MNNQEPNSQISQMIAEFAASLGLTSLDDASGTIENLFVDPDVLKSALAFHRDDFLKLLVMRRQDEGNLFPDALRDFKSVLATTYQRLLQEQK